MPRAVVGGARTLVVPEKMPTVIRQVHESMPDDGEHFERFNFAQGLRKECMLSPLLFDIFFAAVIHAMLIRFIDYPDIGSDSADLEKDLREDGVNIVSLSFVRRVVWGMMCADDAGIVSKSTEGIAKIMTVIVTVLEAAGLAVSETERRPYSGGHRIKHPRLHRSSSKQRDRGKDDDTVFIPGWPCRHNRCDYVKFKR